MFLDECIKFTGYKLCLDNPDLWMRPMKRSSYGFKHYEYVLLYVDNVLVIGDDITEVLYNIDKYFGLNPDSLSNPKIYLSANMKLTRM